MTKGMKNGQICAYSMQRDKMKSESGVSGNAPKNSSTSLCANTANENFRDDSNTRAISLHGAGENMCAPQATTRKEGADMTDDKKAPFEHSTSALDAYGASLNFEDRIASFDLELIERIRVELDVPEDEWMEYLKMLYILMVSFVDAGWGLSPLQQACGKDDEIVDQGSKAELGVVSCQATTLCENFSNKAAE